MITIGFVLSFKYSVLEKNYSFRPFKPAFYLLTLQAQAPGCPNIVAGPPITLQCTDSCTQLSSTFLATGETTSYAVSSIPYAPPYPYGLERLPRSTRMTYGVM